MSGIVGSLFNHRGSGIIAKLGTDGHTFNSAGAGKKALTEAVVVVADGVDGSKLADDAGDSEHYTDGSIDNAHVADDAIDSEHYADGSIDNAHIADDAIDSEHYAAGSIDTAHVADDQVTLAKMAGLARGKLIYGDSSGDPAALAVGSADQVLTHDGTDLAWATPSGGGITVADCWRLTTEFSGDADPIASNLEQIDETEEGTIGSAMTESSGIFTFPATGIYLVSFGAAFSMAGSSRYNHIEMQATSDNSSYATRGYASQQVVNDGSSYSQGFIQNLIDVTNTTNVKVKFKINVEDSGCTTRGNTNSTSTFMMFIRLGDT